MNRHVWKLKSKLVIVAFFSAAIALAFFFVVRTAGDRLVETYADSQTFQDSQEKRIYNKIQQVINRESLSLNDGEQLWRLCQTAGVYQFWLIRENQIIYDANHYLEGTDVTELIDSGDELHTLSFRDGTAQVLLFASFAERYYLLSTLFACAAAAILFALLYTALLNKRLKYIIFLEREMHVLEGGDLTHVVTVKGRDELGQLAASINDMRLTIMQQKEGEERATRASRELVASMSHDLRTPLTALIGYLELLYNKRCESPAQQDEFTGRALQKAYRIKSMTDELFQCALSELGETRSFHGERLDAALFSTQLLTDWQTDIENQGFQVLMHLENLSGEVDVEPEGFVRVFENLFSNIRKYADPNAPIHLRCSLENGMLQMIVENKICACRTSGSGLGLRTCEKILLRHKGTFSVHDEDGWFSAVIRLPVIAGASTGAVEKMEP